MYFGYASLKSQESCHFGASRPSASLKKYVFFYMASLPTHIKNLDLPKRKIKGI